LLLALAGDRLLDRKIFRGPCGDGAWWNAFWLSLRFARGAVVALNAGLQDVLKRFVADTDVR